MEHQKIEHRGALPRRLLIVDDEEPVCSLLSRFFALKGYETRSVCRGEEAVALASAFHPHVVLLDLLMPGMSGMDTLKQLKRLSPAPKVIMLSSADHEEVAKGSLELGADLYVCKPADLGQLEVLVNGFCPSQARQ